MNEFPAEVLAVPSPLVTVLALDSAAPYAAALLAGLEAANRGESLLDASCY